MSFVFHVGLIETIRQNYYLLFTAKQVIFHISSKLKLKINDWFNIR